MVAFILNTFIRWEGDGEEEKEFICFESIVLFLDGIWIY